MRLADSFGSLPIYAIFLAAAVLVGFAVSFGRLRATDVPRVALVRLLMLGAAGGLAGAKLYSVVERGGAVWWDPIWELDHGYRYPGGILGAALAVAVSLRGMGQALSAARIGDAFAPGIAAALCVARVGCFLSGCCHGIPASVPWAIRFPAGSESWSAHVARGWVEPSAIAGVPVHPLQIYFLLGSLLTLVAVLWFHPWRRYDGQTFLVFLVLDGVLKFSLEQLRLEARPSLQAAALLFAVLGVVGLVRNRTGGVVGHRPIETTTQRVLAP